MASPNARKNRKEFAVCARILLVPSMACGASAVLVACPSPSSASDFEARVLPNFCAHLNDVLRYAHDGQAAALAGIIERSAARLYELKHGRRPAYLPPLDADGHIDVPRMSRTYINSGVRLAQRVRDELRTCAIEASCMRSLGVSAYSHQWTKNLDSLGRDLNRLIDLASGDATNQKKAAVFVARLVAYTKSSAEWLARVNGPKAAM